MINKHNPEKGTIILMNRRHFLKDLLEALIVPAPLKHELWQQLQELTEAANKSVKWEMIEVQMRIEGIEPETY